MTSYSSLVQSVCLCALLGSAMLMLSVWRALVAAAAAPLAKIHAAYAGLCVSMVFLTGYSMASIALLVGLYARPDGVPPMARVLGWAWAAIGLLALLALGWILAGLVHRATEQARRATLQRTDPLPLIQPAADRLERTLPPVLIGIIALVVGALALFAIDPYAGWTPPARPIPIQPSP